MTEASLAARAAAAFTATLKAILAAVARLFGRSVSWTAGKAVRIAKAAPGVVGQVIADAPRDIAEAVKGIVTAPFTVTGAALGAVARPIADAVRGRMVPAGPAAPAAAEKPAAPVTAVDVAQDVGRIAKKMAIGATVPEDLLQRIPSDQRAWLQQLDTSELLLVGRASPARLKAHLSGVQPLEGVPSREELAIRSVVRADTAERAELSASSPLAARIRARRDGAAPGVNGDGYAA